MDISEPCSKLNCYYDDSDVVNMEFNVRKCEDPVTVDVDLSLYNGYSYPYYEYNQSETFQFQNYSFSAILERNATHLAFMVSLIY